VTDWRTKDDQELTATDIAQMRKVARKVLDDPANREPDIAITLTLRDGGVIEVWQREERSAGELADLLRVVADGFDADGFGPDAVAP
jgi:hypothetical protein